MTSHPRGTLFLLDTGTPGTRREDTAKMSRGKLELATRSGNRNFFPVVGRYFLIIFLSAICWFHGSSFKVFSIVFRAP